MLRQSGKIDAFENHRQSASSELDGLGITEHCRKSEGAGFEAFVPNSEAVAIPVKDFHPRMVAVEKNEEVSRERIGSEFAPNDADETVERLPQIDGRGAERDASVVRNG